MAGERARAARGGGVLASMAMAMAMAWLRASMPLETCSAEGFSEWGTVPSRESWPRPRSPKLKWAEGRGEGFFAANPPTPGAAHRQRMEPRASLSETLEQFAQVIVGRSLRAMLCGGGAAFRPGPVLLRFCPRSSAHLLI